MKRSTIYCLYLSPIQNAVLKYSTDNVHNRIVIFNYDIGADEYLHILGVF